MTSPAESQPPLTGKTHRTREEKQRIVEETLTAGASVALVARAHGVNANQVFAWRKLHREGKLLRAAASVKLLPVHVANEERAMAAAAASIQVEFANARLHIEGSIDERTLRTLLECLRG